jgi:hypothetical protein
MHKWPTFYGVFGAAFDIDAWSFWGGEDQVFFCANPGDDQGYGFTGWSHQMWNMWYVSRGEAASLCDALWSSLIPTGYGQKWCRWLCQAILCHRGVLRGWRGRLQSFRGYTGVTFLPYVEPRFLQSWYDESIQRSAFGNAAASAAAAAAAAATEALGRIRNSAAAVLGRW